MSLSSRDGLRMSAAMSFYGILSLAPLPLPLPLLAEEAGRRGRRAQQEDDAIARHVGENI